MNQYLSEYKGGKYATYAVCRLLESFKITSMPPLPAIPISKLKLPKSTPMTDMIIVEFRENLEKRNKFCSTNAKFIKNTSKAVSISFEYSSMEYK